MNKFLARNLKLWKKESKFSKSLQGLEYDGTKFGHMRIHYIKLNILFRNI